MNSQYILYVGSLIYHFELKRRISFFLSFQKTLKNEFLHFVAGLQREYKSVILKPWEEISYFY
jgi:hypothetical protein